MKQPLRTPGNSLQYEDEHDPQDSDPYENLAEGMNRTMKEEFGLCNTLTDLQQAKELARQFVELYNNYRPHLSLQMNTPEQAHLKIKIPGSIV